MTDKKLTPRVGDRVLVMSCGKTKVGNVLSFGHGGTYASVSIDGWGLRLEFLTSGLQVVDRDPVEWPEGWSRSILSGHAKLALGVDGSSVSLTKHEVECILAAGPAMLRDWPELMGGAE